MKKQYEKATIEICMFQCEDIITTSSVGLTDGGEKGTGDSDTFDNLFK